ncbi:glycosyltransferase family A protein [Thalassomonas haliotis]|uniref:Glycosyltransferase family 2 protein n=1 Tax=Thalassomonas haliotis TaxID=485448 RepID=A0ABY7VKU4_9GAMM|nr:glycosyltransferase family A protein [Thalassomonas haliotis]WDE13287.1 glycosyltransferase family 2 protein [Thalassomonas haliotis]
MLTFVISTLNDGLSNIQLPPEKPNVWYTIVHQYTKDYDFSGLEANPVLKSRNDLNYYELQGKGLSKSRNYGLSKVRTRYCYILDDDIALMEHAQEEVIAAFEKNINADIITFQHSDEFGKLKKNARLKAFFHNKFTIARVASIDIAIKVDSLRKHNLLFDSAFGLGTDLPSGEEFIFLSDCLKSGLIVLNSAAVITSHPQEASGIDFVSNREKILAKREMFKRVTGKKISMMMVLFYIKKLPSIISRNKFRTFTKTYFSLR